MQGSRHIQGASTITQQVAKNFLLNSDRTFDRKIREILLSLRIESAYSKEEILELYLNEIYLGLSNYGVAAAALNYFNKSVHELTIAEVAYLAALPKEPSSLNPFRDHDRAVERRNYVIGRMEEDGYITAKQANEARAEPLVVNPRVLTPNSIAAGFFAEEVRRELSERYGEQKLYEGGLSVRTTLDPKIQLMARKALVDGLVRYDEAYGWHGTLKTIDIGQDWGVPLADIPAYGDIKPWVLAVALDVGDTAIADRPPAGARQVGRGRRRPPDGLGHARGRQMDGPDAEEPGQAGRRLLCRTDRRPRRRISAAPDSGSVRRRHRHGSVHRARARDGRRIFVRRVRIQSGDAGAAPAGLLVQAVRLCGGARQRLYALFDRSRRAGHNRRWQRPIVGAAQLRGHIQRAAHAAVRRRALDQPDDGQARARHRHAAGRRIRQALRHLRQSAAVPVDVDRRGRDDRAADDHRLFDVRQRRQAGEGDADRPDPGSLGQYDLQARRTRLRRVRRPRRGTISPSRA